MQQPADPVETVPHPRQQGQPLVRQGQPARQAAEKLGTQSGLQPLDLMADGGLGDTQFNRRLGKGEMAGRRLKGAQGIQWQVGAGHGLAMADGEGAEIPASRGFGLECRSC